MKSKIILIILLTISGRAFAQTDSLAHYLNVAAQNNPTIKAEFLTYKASLERVPQASPIPDPQLEMGFFLKPMEIIDGKQIANFQLMQMFPWFGTRRAARNEATEMARMAYEKFRETRDNLFFEVKNSWYTLQNLQQQLTNIRENRVLLVALKELSTNRFAAPSVSGSAKTSAQSIPATSPTQPAASGGMAGMEGATGSSVQPQQAQSMGQMSGGGAMSGGTGGGMSDVLRIELELNELEEQEQALLSQITTAKARFNSLLSRSAQEAVILPDSISQRVFSLDDDFIMETIRRQNPMLAMANAEADAYKAKLEMDKKMGLPMLGIGLQYSVIGKRMDMGIPISDMNGKDMIMPMVTVSIPIWRKKYTAAQNESRFMRQAAEQKHQSTLDNLTSEYISIREQLADAQRKVMLYEKQRRLAEATYQLSLREYAAGMSSISNVLDIERQLLEYKFKRSSAVATYNTVVAMIENLLSEPQNE